MMDKEPEDGLPGFSHIFKNSLVERVGSKDYVQVSMRTPGKSLS